MDSETYWQQRMEELEQHWHDKGRQTIEKELQALYEDALDAIQDDIAALYGRFAKDNELSVVEAMRLLQGREYRKWRMSIDAYVAQIAATGDKELEKELNVLAMRSRITRLDKLYAETLLEIAKLDQETRDKISEFLPSAYRDFYYHTLYDIGQKHGLDSAVSQVDSEQIEKVLRTPWSGKNYSARIWKNGRKLAQTIRDVTVQAVHRGSSIQALSQQVSQRMGVGYRQSVRLVRTELNYVQNHAILDGIKDSGMKYYRFVATLDKRTSPQCRSHDGHVYPVDDYSPGSTAPPLHPHCRSTIVGSLKGDSKPRGKRAARNADGKYIRVPADMTYKEWYQRYVDRMSTGEKIFAHHDLENGIIKADKSNVKGTAYGVNLVTSKKGGKTWNFYDGSGLQYLQVSDNDHGHKKESVFGTHGEHAHWYNVDSKGIPRHGKAIEIPAYVRKALGDQL
ncbi:minor capsid protein [uncultured Mitsuokella sp.]|uniref:minor capsid protein n=1 Tax=uncultured Mitsuokella sp. TaxID=453120 RepID=UPI00259A3E06|nr:minor capsid protein [uncultured Mitsuokella sp.]